MSGIGPGDSPLQQGEALHKTDDEISLIGILQVLADNLKSLVFIPLAVGVIVLLGSFAITPTFTATATFLPPQQQQSSAFGMLQSLGALSGLAGAAAGIKNPTDQYIGFLRSNTVQGAVVTRFDLKTRYEVKYLQKARDILKAKSRISAGKEGLINVEFDDKDPIFAAEVANGYVEELGELLNRLAITEAQQRRVFFEKQLGTAKDNLIRAEQSLAASGVSAAALNASPSVALEGPAKLRALVTAQEVKLASMRAYLTPAAPEFRQAQLELSALRNQLLKAEQEQPAGKAGSNDYIAKYREFKYQETLFELFAKQYELARIDESREGATIQVIDRASAPELKSSPKRGFLAVGATVAAGMIMLIVAFARYALNNVSAHAAGAEQLLRLKASLRQTFRRR
ncbi:Wzz/FepE/Etk N-terminal domain-containing protein [Pigmentiphaga litoralis]|uniref:Wzz/FepE/Etk N-terminal domain-containing protein n=1 Tax=Pigmentiphaga litoralis TaxID=516702 RepID=UPI003B42B572